MQATAAAVVVAIFAVFTRFVRVNEWPPQNANGCIFSNKQHQCHRFGDVYWRKINYSINQISNCDQKTEQKKIVEQKPCSIC